MPNQRIQLRIEIEQLDNALDAIDLALLNGTKFSDQQRKTLNESSKILRRSANRLEKMVKSLPK